MAHEIENKITSENVFTSDEVEALIKLIQHPKIKQLIEEVEDK